MLDPALAILSVILVVAGIIDLRTRRIPNLLVAFGLAFGLAVSYSTLGLSGMGSAFSGMGVALLLFVPLFLLRALGAGDVKLMMVVGSFLGPQDTFMIALLSFAASGVLALVDAMIGRRIGSLFRRTSDAAFALAARNVGLASSIAQTGTSRLPFAVAILIGAAVWLFYFR